MNQLWAADLTYIRTSEGWLFLAVVIDLASRRVIGWSMSARADPQLTLQALGMAVQKRRPRPGLVHHADRGVQYSCTEYRAALRQWGLEESYSRLGNCWDNAVAESFFHTLKTERVDRRTYRTRAEARSDLFQYLEVWYNRERRHSALGNVSPAEFEGRLS